TGGHQLKNALVLAERRAVKVVDEATLRQDNHALMPALVDLLDNPHRAAEFGKKLGEFAEPDSAKRLAVVLLDVAAERPQNT
ncbi:MAG: UDP-N-acetylglucosamine--N-acetylmuramyl-(pentapeptide) pyrophosphoryl-undecaprenol N-acetylglucosamine transferase, partial [Patescibacteria group bacterium]